jgi:hypothetical protein
MRGRKLAPLSPTILDVTTQEVRMKDKAPVVKQLYRLSVEPRVVDQLARVAARTGEPKSRLATRLFTEAVMAFKPAARSRAKAVKT